MNDREVEEAMAEGDRLFSTEPTYTLAQVKEIIEGIAVRVEREIHCDCDRWLDIVCLTHQAIEEIRETSKL